MGRRGRVDDRYDGDISDESSWACIDVNYCVCRIGIAPHHTQLDIVGVVAEEAHYKSGLVEGVGVG